MKTFVKRDNLAIRAKIYHFSVCYVFESRICNVHLVSVFILLL